MASERSSSIYFKPTVAANETATDSSRIIIVADEDINNYTNRYDIVLLKSLNTSVSMAELDVTNTESIPARRPRRSLPAFANRYIDV